MKPILLIAALFISLNAFADAGGCILYKAKYVLRSGESVMAYVPIGGLSDYAYLDENTHTNKYCNDLEFQRMINTVFYNEQHQMEFNVYKAVYKVRYSKSALSQAGTASMRCMFSDSSSMVRLNLDSIRYTVFLGAENADLDYPDVHLMVYNDRISRLMQENEVVQFTGLYHEPVKESSEPEYYYTFDAYLALNYNKTLTPAQFKKELDAIAPEMYALEMKYVQEKKMRGEKFYREKDRVAKSIMGRLQQKNIVLIPVIAVT